MTREKLVRIRWSAATSRKPLCRRSRPDATRHKRAEKVLTVENVTMGAVVKNMSFSVYAGEVVGIAGLVGSGRTEIAKIICGALKRNLINGGMIYLQDRPIRYRVPNQAISDGIVLYHRRSQARRIFRNHDGSMTISMSAILQQGGGRSFLLSRDQAQQACDQWIKRLKISALKRRRDRRIFRRQPAKGRHCEIARAGPIDRDFRRADARRRRRRHSANSRANSPPGRGQQSGGRDFLLSAGNPRRLGSHAGCRGSAASSRNSTAATATEDKIMYAAIH